MDTPIVVALIGGWTTIIAGLIDVRRRVNGPLDDLRADVRDMKADMREFKTEFREHLRSQNESN